VDGGEDVGAVLGDGGYVAADGVPVAGGPLGAEPARDLLLGFRWPQVSFRVVGRRWYPQVGGEAEHVVLPVAQAFEQVAAGPLLAATSTLDLAEAGMTPWRNARIRGAAMSPGTAGRPWARAVFAAWIRPCRASVIWTGQCASRVFLRGVLKIA
jgi:hypothetical protein